VHPFLRLRRLEPFSPQPGALRAVVRTRDDLVGQRIAAANQLSAVPDTFWPGAKQVFADVESPIARAQRHPSFVTLWLDRSWEDGQDGRRGQRAASRVLGMPDHVSWGYLSPFGP